MFKKFKSFLFKIIKDKRLKIILFSFVILFSIFIPLKRVDAVFGVGDIGLFDFTQTQLDALDFIDGVILRLVVHIASLIVASEVFIVTAANLLQWAMNLPINIGETNLLVTSGWQFILGLTNLFFILVFVIIALAHILGLSNFEMKKTLPKLIIMALLVNFSLVFMGIFIDIVSIFQSSLLSTLGENLVTLAIQPLISSSKSVTAWLFLIPISVIASASAPFWNAIALMGIGTLVLTDIAVGGIFLKGLFLIIINFLIGGIFFSYFTFFLMRIVMIWILAIFAPFAFLSSVLTQTESFWKEWYKTFMEWLILGIAVIFLTGLGLKLFSTVNEGAILNWGGTLKTGRGSLPSFIYNYLFLLVYMGISFIYSIKYTPQMAQTLLNYGKGLMGRIGKMATTETMKRDVWGPAAEHAAGGLGALGKRLTARAERGLGTAGTGGKLFWGAVKGVGKGIKKPSSSLIEYAAQQRKIATPKGWGEMTIDDKTSFIGGLTQDKEKLVLASKMKGEGTYQKSTDAYFKKEILAIRDKFADDPRFAKEVGDLNDAKPDEIGKEAFIKSKLIRISPTEIDAATGRLKRDVKTEEIEADIQAIINEHGLAGPDAEKVATGVLYSDGFNAKDVAGLSKESAESLSVQLASRKWGSSELRALQSNFGQGTVRAVLNKGSGLNTITEAELCKIYNENSSLVRWAFINPGGKEMLNWAKKFQQNWSKDGVPNTGICPPPGGPPVAPPPVAPPPVAPPPVAPPPAGGGVQPPAGGGVQPPAGGGVQPPAGRQPRTATPLGPLGTHRATTHQPSSVEQHLMSRLEEEKRIKENISENKDKFRKAKTARTRISLQKQIEEKQERLKAVQANTKLLQKAYKQEYAEEKLKEKAKPEKPILLKDIGDLEQLDQATEKIESENVFMLSKLDTRKKTSELTEKEQEAYRQYKETYDNAVKERESIKEKLGSARAFARVASRRLRNIASQKQKLGKDKKDSLMKGDLSKSMNIESALIMLREEKEKEIKKYEQTADQALEYIKSAKEQDEILLKDAQTEINKLSEHGLIKEIEDQMGRAKKDGDKATITNLEERHPSVFEEIPKIKKKLKNSTKQALKKERLKLNKLKSERITVIGTANPKKIEQANNRVKKQTEKIDNLRGSLTDLIGDVQGVLEKVEIEEGRGRETM